MGNVLLITVVMVILFQSANAWSNNTTSEVAVGMQKIGAFTGLKTDIQIGEVDGVTLRINIALPKKTSNELRPAIVLIHGGGLIKGDKDLMNKRVEAMARKGIIAASAMYRLAPEHRFPTAIEDVKAAIRFLKAHAKELNLDPDRIVVSGASAGGYLATMVGVTGNASGFSDHGMYPKFDSSVRAVIAHSPPVADYTHVKYQDFAVVKRFIRSEAQDRQAALEEISPISYLDKKDPPFFLVHGTADEIVPVEMTREFAIALKELEHEYEYIEVDGGKHSLNASRPEKAKEAFKASMDFFSKYAFPNK